MRFICWNTTIYIWIENSSPKSEASFVLTAQTETIERHWNWRPIDFNFRHQISYFDIDLKNNTMVLWSEYSPLEKN
jgi:hypothetical protein